jgi:hypothetical protein
MPCIIKYTDREGPYTLGPVRKSSSQSNGPKGVGPILLYTIDKIKISMSCVTFWVVLRRRRTTNFNPHSFRIHLPMKMEQTECSEMSAIKHHTPENNPKGYTRRSEHGESLKSKRYPCSEMLCFKCLK